MKKLLLAIIIAYVPICLWGQSDTGYVRKIYNNLNGIKSASYFWHQSASAIYDTIPSVNYRVFKKEVDNPDDKLVGAFIASFQFEDTTRLVYFYDGEVQSYLDWERKTIPVDSFQHDRYPFRIIYPPFFTHLKCLLKYALETTDSTSILVSDYKDSVLIRLTVPGKLVEVVGNRIVYGAPAIETEDQWSVYEIWISKPDDLPYRFVKKFPDRVCGEICKDIKINTTDKIVFIASEYFPPDFAVKFNENKKTHEKNLVGNAAPGWRLRDADNNETGLDDLKSKVLIIQFTGIGCGPCYQSIPYLIKIRDQFKREEFEMVSIETWNNDISVIKKHISVNRINFKYLIGNSEVKLKYGIQSVPKFFVLDEKRVVRKIIAGFDIEKTFVELKETVDQLINE